MKYKIGEFAKLVGMEPSKIRYYEKKGVFRKKREENGYRLFDTLDARHINIFRTLCNRGYSIKEAIACMNGVSLKEAIREFEENGERIDLEICFIKRRKEYIDETLIYLKGVKEDPYRIWKEEISTCMVHPASEEGDFIFAQKNACERVRWHELIPFTRFVGFGNTKNFLTNQDKIIDHGESVKKEDFEEWDYPVNETIKEYEMGECICFYGHLDENESINIKDYPYVEQYIKSHEIKLKDYFLFFYAMVPVEELGRDSGIMCIPMVQDNIYTKSP